MSVRLRLGVDGRAFSSPAGGVRRYAGELYRAMLALAPDLEVLAIGAPAAAALPAGIQPVAAMPLPTNLGWMAASIPLAARRAKLDVYHAPAYTAPLWGVHPQVLTIHDVSYERHPEWNAYKNDRFRRAFYRRSALAADRIVTDSTFSKQEIADVYRIPPDRIDVIPLAAAGSFEPGPVDVDRFPPGVRRPYALHVGDLHARRNLETALQAVLSARQSESVDRLQFVCAGIDRGTATALRQTDTSDALVLTGPLADDVLLNLYRGASVLLYPSRYEGFGLPVLEAMQCGVPVIAANAASLPEIVGDAGLLLAPLDVDDWASAIVALMKNPGMSERLSAAGIARATGYSWRRTASATLDVLRASASAAAR